jgi:DNA modification methylase
MVTAERLGRDCMLIDIDREEYLKAKTRLKLI